MISVSGMLQNFRKSWKHH